MIIQENTICYASQIGHNNFYYPSNNRLFIKENCQVEKVSWIGGGDKIPIKILKCYLAPLSMTASVAKNTSPPNKNEYTVVWIEKKYT